MNDSHPLISITRCITIVGLLSSGCSHVALNQSEPALSAQAAQTIATDLVNHAARTVELRPAGQSYCLARGPHPDDRIDNAFEQALRQAGYALQTPSGSGHCLTVQTGRFSGITHRVQFATACLGQGAKMLCREYRLPDAVATSAMTLRELTLAPEPAQRRRARSGPCSTAPLLDRALVLSTSRLRFIVPASVDAIGNRFESARHCVLIRTPNDSERINQALLIEQHLRRRGVASDRIERLVADNTDDGTAIAVELRGRKKP